MIPNADTGYTAETWEFDEEVTRVFENMLTRSIPGYTSMREVVTAAAVQYAAGGGLIADLGLSLGNALLPIMRACRRQNTYEGYEISEPMLIAARETFRHFPDDATVTIHRHDLRDGVPVGEPWRVVLLVLTLMFVPVEYRQNILSGIYQRLSDGGALIIVEKVLADDAEINARLVDMYHDYKRDHGYSDDAIDRKRLALEGVLVPLRGSENERILRSVGFTQVECIWRYLNFAGWLAVRETG